MAQDYIATSVNNDGSTQKAFFDNIKDALFFCQGIEHFSVWTLYRRGVNAGELGAEYFDFFGDRYFKIDEMTTFPEIREAFFDRAKEAKK